MGPGLMKQNGVKDSGLGRGKSKSSGGSNQGKVTGALGFHRYRAHPVKRGR